VRLLIDEMYPPTVAAQLRRAGYDAISVHDDANTRGLDDPAVCGLALSAGRAVVTENAADFLRMLRYRAAAEEPTPTLVITLNRSFPRHSASFIGQVVRALCTFCETHRKADASAGAVYWLQPIPWPSDC
jgi:predicted nuclease of predicted toxin-antitoxin system